jgi:DNA polymerase III subunit chi
MVDIRFYHLTRSGMEHVLPELLEKTLARGWRAVVMTSADERAESLTHHLWTYNANTFLPHGNTKDGHAADQPIWLTAADERPNNAQVLFLTDGAESAQLGDYERVCDIFDGNDEEALAAARQRWARYKAAEHNLSYWQQGEAGWVEKVL